MNDGQGAFFFPQNFLDLFVEFDATSYLKLNWRTVCEKLVTHLLKLQVSQVDWVVIVWENSIVVSGRPIMRIITILIICLCSTTIILPLPLLTFVDSWSLIETVIILWIRISVSSFCVVWGHTFCGIVLCLPFLDTVKLLGALSLVVELEALVFRSPQSLLQMGW